VWKRPREVYGEESYKLYEMPKNSDLTQGHCENSYFLAAVSAIAEAPRRIRNIFLTKERNIAGCYAVSFFINGEKKTVVVDDRLPYDEQN